MTNKLSNKVFYINMDSQPNRNKHIIKLLNDIGFTDINRITPKYNKISYLSITETHKSIIEKIANFDTDSYYCIFEDDIELSKDIPRNKAKQFIIDRLNNISNNNGFIYLGVCLDENQIKTCYYNNCNAWCAHAYMLNPKGAQWLLKTIKNWDGHIDAIFNSNFSAPVIGYRFSHDHTLKNWKGLFYQGRNEIWYEDGENEIFYKILRKWGDTFNKFEYVH